MGKEGFKGFHLQQKFCNQNFILSDVSHVK